MGMLWQIWTLGFSLLAIGEVASGTDSPRQLSQWIPQVKSLALDGHWHFYWQEWLEPNENLLQAEVKAEVGMSWNQFKDLASGQVLGPKGFASYLLEIQGLKPSADGYIISLANLGQMAEIYVFPKYSTDFMQRVESDRAQLSNGSSFKNSASLSVGFRPQSQEQIWTVLIKVANAHLEHGGLLAVPQLSSGRTPL